MIGFVLTAWSAVRSSRLLQYALIAVVMAGLVFWYLTARDKRVVAEVMARATAAIVKRMERNREIHREIKRLPLGERANRLRKLNSPR